MSLSGSQNDQHEIANEPAPMEGKYGKYFHCRTLIEYII